MTSDRNFKTSREGSKLYLETARSRPYNGCKTGRGSGASIVFYHPGIHIGISLYNRPPSRPETIACPSINSFGGVFTTLFLKQEEDLGPAGTPGDTTPIKQMDRMRRRSFRQTACTLSVQHHDYRTPLTMHVKQEEDLGPAGTPGDTTPIEAVGTLGVWIPDGAV